LDVDDLILETNETNNMASITISVKENTSNLLPDLRIHGISQSSANPLVGSDVQFTIEVQNQGTAVADSVLVRLFIDDELVGSKTIASIPAGAVASTEFEWGARTGEHVITVEIDSFNTILESDETNNIYTNDISVGDNPQGLPLDPGTLWMCLGGIITFIMIILVLLVIMARKGSRTTGMTGPQYQVPKDRVGIRDYGTTSPLEPVPASIRPSSTRSPSRTYQGGQAVCKRCGSTDIKYFNDGHMQCKHCRKIFF
jgi:uncharacterized repeat protein (TIGR01451 family)